MAESDTKAKVPAGAAMDAVRLLLAVAGVVLIGYGAWLHYPPAGFVSAGVLLFGIALIGTLRAR